MMQEFKKIIEIAETISIENIYQLPPHEYDAVQKAIQQLDRIFVLGKFKNSSHWRKNESF